MTHQERVAKIEKNDLPVMLEKDRADLKVALNTPGATTTEALGEQVAYAKRKLGR